jgi:hypothetical protein
MNDLVFMVPANEWTVEEFERQMRGFRAKLIAFGDVFKGEAAPVAVPAKKPKKERARPLGVTIRQSYRGQVLGVITKLAVGQMTFFPHADTDHTQRRICNAVYDHRKLTGEKLHVRTSCVKDGDTTGVRVMRIA